VEKSTSVYIDENQDARVLKTVFVTPDRIRHTPAEMSWVARDFRFHTGEVLPELRLHYTTVGDASRPSVLILHGTTGSGSGLLSPSFGGELFGPGQALDASKYLIILPGAIGHGKSSKPSDGMRAQFPRDNYDDMVAAQYRLITEGLGIRHAPDTRQLNGRYAYLDLGHHATRLLGCVGALGLATQ